MPSLSSPTVLQNHDKTNLSDDEKNDDNVC